MICKPCARAADQDAAIRRPDYTPPGHDPSICRDAAFKRYGCACQCERTVAHLKKGADPR